MKKGILTLLLSLVLAFTLCACFACKKPTVVNDSKSTDDSTTSSNNPTDTGNSNSQGGNISDIVVPEGYELVTTKVDFDTLHATYGEGVKLTEVVVQGKFKFSAGSYFYGSTGNLVGKGVNNQKKDIFITLTGEQNSNSIKFDVKGASSGNLWLYDSQGKVVKDYGKITSPQYNLEVKNLPAGTYRLGADGSLRFAQMSITEILKKSNPVGITVTGGVTQLLAGRQFESTGLNVNLNYENGRIDSLTSGFEIDGSNVNMNVAGKYFVNVSYKVEGVAEPFKTEYSVYVYETKDISISDHSLNTKRVTQPVQKIFKVGEEFNHNNLAVVAQAQTTVDEADKDKIEATKSFVLQASEYTVTGAEDINTPGTKNVTVKVNDSLSENYSVYYVDASDAAKSKVKIFVDSTVTEVTTKENCYAVSSVNLAVQMFKALGTANDALKTIEVAPGSYKEKVEIDIPNIYLRGAGNSADEVVLWHDTLAGQIDPSGISSYSTDGSASVSIRDTANNFTAENVTFKNYYNTFELYEASKKLMSDTQAVAMLVQADKVYFKNCIFTSFHDTLYAMYGRQVYDNCYIEGKTDYIFGADATCYFTGCTINSIGANLDKNGGYIVATKGAKGLNYGYIFDNCTLQGDENVKTGSVSLARGWEPSMTIAYLNCNISDKFSLTEFGKKTDGNNERYTNMNAEPVATQLFEYNNTGAGAIPADVLATANADGVINKMCTILTPEKAAQYTNKSVIFAKVQVREGAANYNTPYADDWDGTSAAIK